MATSSSEQRVDALRTRFSVDVGNLRGRVQVWGAAGAVRSVAITEVFELTTRSLRMARPFDRLAFDMDSQAEKSTDGRSSTPSSGSEEVALLDTIAGVGRRVAEILLAEMVAT